MTRSSSSWGRPTICTRSSNWVVQNHGTDRYGSTEPVRSRCATWRADRLRSERIRVGCGDLRDGWESWRNPRWRSPQVRRAESVVDHDAVSDLQVGLDGEVGVRDGADSDEDEVGIDPRSVVEFDRLYAAVLTRQCNDSVPQ